MRQLKKGLLLSIEGIDGSGKTTLAHNLYQSLQNLAFSVIITKEPGGTKLGEKLRTLLQEQPIPITAKAEYLLFAADRANHFEYVIIPALTTGTIVISDRMADSSVVYQGYGRGLDISTIQMINTWAMNTYQPDLTLFVKLSADEAWKRLKQRNQHLTAFEKQKRSFIQTIVSGFDTLFKNKKNVITLDGTLNQQTLVHKATNTIIQFIQEHNLIHE